MKRFFITLMAICTIATGSFAQEDDVYFVPSRNAKTKVTNTSGVPSSSYQSIETPAESNWAEGRGYGHWDVDAYNRRGAYADSLTSDSLYQSMYADSLGLYGSGSGYDCTERIIRFHSPDPGVCISSPYYADFYYDLYWYDPWHYNSWYWGAYNPWWGWSYRYSPYWYSGWYGWYGWYDPWYHPWYDPYWYPGGGRPPHHPGHHPGYAGNGGHRGPTGGYVSYSHQGNRQGHSSTGSRYRSGNRSTRNGGSYSTGYRPSRNYGTSTSGSRSSRSSSSTPSRSYNSGSSTRSTGTPSYNSGSSRSSGSYSSGRSGGGRSFGGGGGSRGGRR